MPDGVTHLERYLFRPGDYRFIDYYQYRLQQDDFIFSFQKEFNRLKKNLDNIVENGSNEMRNGAK